MACRTHRAPAAPGTLIPAAQARRRATVTMTISLCALSAAVVIPALFLRLRHDTSALPILIGVVPGFCLYLLRFSCHAHGAASLVDEGSLFLTARTWTGYRTVDLGNLRSVRAQKMVGAGGSVHFLILRDASGVRLGVSAPADVSATRSMLGQQPQRGQPSAVRVSRLGKATLGTKPPGMILSVAWAVASVVLFAITVWFPVVICALIATAR